MPGLKAEAGAASPHQSDLQRTAAEYSNVLDRPRLRRTSSGPLTCLNDRERPCCREFASRGSGVQIPSAPPEAAGQNHDHYRGDHGAGPFDHHSTIDLDGRGVGRGRQRPTAVAPSQSTLAFVSAGTRSPSLTKLVIVSPGTRHLPIACQPDGLWDGRDPAAVKWLEIRISSLRTVIAPGSGAERRIHAGCADG